MAARDQAGGVGRHRLETVRRACVLLKAFADTEESLTLTEISARTKIEKTVVFRLVHTLGEGGLLRRVDGSRWCLNVRLVNTRKHRLGYAAQTSDSPFCAAVSEGLRMAADRNDLDLIVFDNHYSARTALRAAQQMAAERVDVAIEFQTFANVAPMISGLFRAASIPLIAIEIPHPGATFYGVDNYNAGKEAGRALAAWAKRNWQGKANQLLLLGLEIAGPLPELRLLGAEAAIRESLPETPTIHHLDTRGEFERSLESVRKHLRLCNAMRTLIVGVNDPSVLGALRAFEEAGRADLCAAVGLGAIPPARAEMCRSGTRLIGSVAFFPEHYGEDLVRLALAILHKRHVPPAVYAHHEMVTPELVGRLYPLETPVRDRDVAIR
jgi:ribose transport system substrate-binding protein